MKQPPKPTPISPAPPDIPATSPLRVLDLGRMDYDSALARQIEIHQRVLDGHDPNTLLLLEHDPVITLTRRPAAAAHLLADAPQLEKLSIALRPTDRGGDITYHGPGQLVAYPIVRLNDFGLNVRRYVDLLEEAIIQTLAPFGIAAHRDACAVGVWVGGQAEAQAGPSACEAKSETAPARTGAKIAAIGVRVRHWVTMHGLALNVEPDLSHFDLIVPCGLTGRPVTSMRRILGDRTPEMDRIKRSLASNLQNLLVSNQTGSP